MYKPSVNVEEIVKIKKLHTKVEWTLAKWMPPCIWQE